MEIFKNLNWRIKEPAALNNLIEEPFLSEKVVASLPIFQKSFEELLKDVKLDVKTDQNNEYRRSRIPGFRPLPSYPSTKLSIKDHELYLKYIKFSLNGNQRINFEIQNILKSVQKLEPLIQEERLTYANFVKEKWQLCGLKEAQLTREEVENYFDAIWSEKLKQLEKYPRYYSEYVMIPLVYRDDTVFDLVKVNTVDEQGRVPVLQLFKNNKRNYLKLDKTANSYSGFSPELVSCDNLADQYAQQFNVDVVLSSSGIKHLADNHEPYNSFWKLPLKVKKHSYVDPNGKHIVKNVIYIDKALPKNQMSNIQKNYWIYKHVLNKQLWRGQLCNYPSVLNLDNLSKSDNIKKCENCRLYLKTCAKNTENSNISNQSAKRKSEFKTLKPKRLCIRTVAKINESFDDDNEESHSHEEDIISYKCMHTKAERIPKKFSLNLTYGIWNLSPSDQLYQKSQVGHKSIKILLRSSVNYSKKIGNCIQPVLVFPKLEYQLNYGAEVFKKGNLCRQWLSTFIRPDSIAARFRIDPANSEVIVTEECLKSNIQNEAAFLYNCKLNKSWSFLYSVLNELLSLKPGDYLLSHSPKNGPFVSLMKASLNENGASLDLNKLRKFTIIKDNSSSWTPLDNTILLPNNVEQKVIPGLFKGIESTKNKQWRKKKVKNKKSKKKT